MATYSNYLFRVSTAGKSPLVSGDKRLTLRNIINLFTALITGQRAGGGNASVVVEAAAVAASASITFASVANNDTLTIGGNVFTAKTSGPSGDQFLVGVSNTADAAAAAAVINASATAGVDGAVTATAALGVLTITSQVAGKVGNAVSIATSNGTRLAITGSASRLASGAATRATFAF